MVLTLSLKSGLDPSLRGHFQVSVYRQGRLCRGGVEMEGLVRERAKVGGRKQEIGDRPNKQSCQLEHGPLTSPCPICFLIFSVANTQNK